jgi:hypothetical protein
MFAWEKSIPLFQVHVLSRGASARGFADLAAAFAMRQPQCRENQGPGCQTDMPNRLAKNRKRELYEN